MNPHAFSESLRDVGVQFHSDRFTAWTPHTDPGEFENIDLHVKTSEGHFVATIFTLTGLAALMRKNARTGESGGGLYQWATGMVIARDLTPATLTRMIEDMLDHHGLCPPFERVAESEQGEGADA